MILLTNSIGIILYIILCYICYHTYEMRYVGSGKYVRDKKVSMPYWTVSNSHRDINYRPSKENLTVINVCK